MPVHQHEGFLLTALRRTRRIAPAPESHLSPDIGYPDSDFRGFLQFHLANANTVPLILVPIRPRLFPPESYSIHYSSINAMYSEIPSDIVVKEKTRSQDCGLLE
jgi:hypothetical protein